MKDQVIVTWRLKFPIMNILVFYKNDPRMVGCFHLWKYISLVI